DQYRPLVVLERAGQDLRSTRCGTVDQYGDRRDQVGIAAGPQDDRGTALALVGDHRRPGRQEGGGRLDRLVEQASGVVPDVEYDTGDVLGPQRSQPVAYLKADAAGERADGDPAHACRELVDRHV